MYCSLLFIRVKIRRISLKLDSFTNPGYYWCHRAILHGIDSSMLIDYRFCSIFYVPVSSETVRTQKGDRFFLGVIIRRQLAAVMGDRVAPQISRIKKARSAWNRKLLNLRAFCLLPLRVLPPVQHNPTFSCFLSQHHCWNPFLFFQIKSVPHKAGTQWSFAGAVYFATTVITTIGEPVIITVDSAGGWK